MNQENETQDGDDGDKDLDDDCQNNSETVEDKEQNVDEHRGRRDDHSMSKESDLLEGISEEEFELSDEDVEKDDKLKVADALGVDWSQLITPKDDNTTREKNVQRSFRKQWTPEAIFSRIGLPKSLMRPGHYEQVLERLNKNKKGEEVEKRIKMYHPVAAIHAFHHDKLEKAKADSLRRKPALSARSDLQQRRKLLGLTELQNPIELNIY